MQYRLKNHRLFSNTPRTCTKVVLIQRSCVIITFLICAHAHTWRQKWRRKGSHSYSGSGPNRLVWLQTCIGKVHFSVKNAAVLCENHRERVTQIRTCPSEEEERKTFWPSGDFLVRCFLAPMGVLFVMKTLEDER